MPSHILNENTQKNMSAVQNSTLFFKKCQQFTETMKSSALTLYTRSICLCILKSIRFGAFNSKSSTPRIYPCSHIAIDNEF